MRTAIKAIDREDSCLLTLETIHHDARGCWVGASGLLSKDVNTLLIDKRLLLRWCEETASALRIEGVKPLMRSDDTFSIQVRRAEGKR
jgi:hypothetical protein